MRRTPRAAWRTAPARAPRRRPGGAATGRGGGGGRCGSGAMPAAPSRVRLRRLRCRVSTSSATPTRTGTGICSASATTNIATKNHISRPTAVTPAEMTIQPGRRRRAGPYRPRCGNPRGTVAARPPPRAVSHTSLVPNVHTMRLGRTGVRRYGFLTRRDEARVSEHPRPRPPSDHLRAGHRALGRTRGVPCSASCWSPTAARSRSGPSARPTSSGWRPSRCSRTRTATPCTARRPTRRT